jgi:hypothetical protein
MGDAVGSGLNPGTSRTPRLKRPEGTRAQITKSLRDEPVYSRHRPSLGADGGPPARSRGATPLRFGARPAESENARPFRAGGRPRRDRPYETGGRRRGGTRALLRPAGAATSPLQLAIWLAPSPLPLLAGCPLGGGVRGAPGWGFRAISAGGRPCRRLCLGPCLGPPSLQANERPRRRRTRPSAPAGSGAFRGRPGSARSG